MADDQFKAFLGAVAADSSLLEKLNGVPDADAAVAIAKEAGFAISTEAVENHLKEKMKESEEELTDEQLGAVTGGVKYLHLGMRSWL
jgi:predicted ribosomally synthesized peptide with nif11-like leader